MSICSAHQQQIDNCPACQVSIEDFYKELLVVDRLSRTCYACPSQWEGTLANGQSIYIRYRHGHFSISVNNIDVYSKTINQMADGFLTNEELLEHAPITLQCEIENAC